MFERIGPVDRPLQPRDVVPPGPHGAALIPAPPRSRAARRNPRPARGAGASHRIYSPATGPAARDLSEARRRSLLREEES
jgi:hypothetical protein